MHPAVDHFIERQSPAAQAVLVAARHCLLALDGRIREEFKWNTPFYCYLREVFYLTLTPNKTAVRLCFVRGAALADPAGQLLGLDRKLIRFVPLTAPTDLTNAYLLGLLHQALLLDEDGHRLGHKTWQLLPSA